MAALSMPAASSLPVASARTARSGYWHFALALMVFACARDHELAKGAKRVLDASAGQAGEVDAAGVTDWQPTLPGEPLQFNVAPDQDTFVSLERGAVVENARRDSLDWDLAFSGYEIYSNGGASGPGKAAEFGPSQDLDLLFDAPPRVPFRADAAVGALSYWYTFSDNTIYSRAHVYGVKDGTRFWKVQFLSYYSDADAGPVAGVYSLRYQELTPGRESEIVESDDLDATVGGLNSSQDLKGACIDFASGQVVALTSAEAHASKSWHLCLRRTEAFINSGYSGPGQVMAVDLDRGRQESAASILRETQSSMLDRFQAVDYAALSDAELEYAGDDQVRSVFGSGWVDAPGPDASPLPESSWLVRAADGTHYYGLLFSALEGPSRATPGTISMRIKAFAQAVAN
jgi:hypothetical protein